VFDDARVAVGVLKKTFEHWLAIGKSVVLARQIADRRGGRKTFMRVIEQQGLGKIVDKATASRMEKIMGPENLPGVLDWHHALTEKEQIAWAAPTSIFNHCPIFKKPPPADKPPSAFQKLKDTNIALQEENYRLKQREDGDRFKPTDTAEDIATVMVGMFTPRKADDIARRMLAKLEKRKSKAAEQSFH
jgi:hypothetical protein